MYKFKEMSETPVGDLMKKKAGEWWDQTPQEVRIRKMANGKWQLICGDKVEDFDTVEEARVEAKKLSNGGPVNIVGI